MTSFCPNHRYAKGYRYTLNPEAKLKAQAGTRIPCTNAARKPWHVNQAVSVPKRQLMRMYSISSVFSESSKWHSPREDIKKEQNLHTAGKKI